MDITVASRELCLAAHCSGAYFMITFWYYSIFFSWHLPLFILHVLFVQHKWWKPLYTCNCLRIVSWAHEWEHGPVHAHKVLEQCAQEIFIWNPDFLSRVSCCVTSVPLLVFLISRMLPHLYRKLCAMQFSLAQQLPKCHGLCQTDFKEVFGISLKLFFCPSWVHLPFCI